MLGSPVAHSLSPVLHRAAYAALGLDSWRYDALECAAAALPGFVAGLGPEWAGLSVTMPGKQAALAVAASATPTALAVGAANTLVRLTAGRPDLARCGIAPIAPAEGHTVTDGSPGRWLADCTDVDGVVGALRAAEFEAGSRAVVLGAGGTACAALVGLARLDVTSVVVVARSAGRAGAALACAQRVGLAARVAGWPELPSACADADVVISTVPAGAADAAVDAIAGCPLVLDVVYHPWPTPLARAVLDRGGRLASGLDMLLHQAFGQVQLFTGRPAPAQAMHTALTAALPNGPALLSLPACWQF